MVRWSLHVLLQLKCGIFLWLGHFDALSHIPSTGLAYVHMYALGRVVQRMRYTTPDLKLIKSEVVWYHSLIVSLRDIGFSNTRCPHNSLHWTSYATDYCQHSNEWCVIMRFIVVRIAGHE